MKRHGRKRPYTAKGVRRLPCVRCGRPAVHQWAACADGNLHRPICTRCDYALNRLVLLFMRDSAAENKLRKYKRGLGL